MVNIVVLGGNEFTVGFQLAGIRETIDVSDNPEKDINELKNRKDISVVVVDETVLENFDMEKRLELEDSVDPVFIPVSTKAEQGSLKRLIKKSIGIELW
ncbi:hypothetical protein CL615_02695 [archaeon]|jgi:vacuolar-type H+-ATPase subunit F/Vma7|nr:hypothetical protein [archaeon]MDP6547784.1 V-type ATP synthase subunit F [Candidatus Woesearchaeota archaeon]MDP7263717.1 V-type ATP synthase subunit F [Candidatus Woesearchaeota archaeon]HJN56493.1 V-type ATP synthase subunit F [Candidatus Woesearchaeota archaeon]|tara:strand:- start:11484 stop:11780 length:297 start_codon:yes stop_codon:yes gene_type:complete